MKYLAAVFLMALLAHCYGHRILFLSAVGSKSHKINYMPIAEALAARGHQVTVVNPFPGLETRENVREINIENLGSKLQLDWFQAQQEDAVSAVKTLLHILSAMSTNGYDILMENEEFRKVIQTGDVDLVVVDSIANDFVLPIVDSLKVPFVFYSATSALSSTLDGMEIPREYATVPSGMLGFHSNMNFFQRIVNVATTELFSALSSVHLDQLVDEHVRKDFPNARSVADIKRDASLCLINHPLVTAYPRPLPPNVIPIGPLHVRPAKPLPMGLQLMADESTDGFIVFSLGSFISGSSMPEHLLQVFVNVFAKLPQRVFWKWEKGGETKFPPNVVLLDWIPQQDLIAHPNCRLLISHGGLLGLQESIYHGMPFLGLPFGSDQNGNMARAIEEGYALKLDWDKVSEYNLFDAIASLINESSYRENAVRVSSLMRDEILPAKDVAVYWIEHVLRHGGGSHLQPASRNLNFIQKHLIDVWLFLGALLVLLEFFLFMIVRWVFKCLTRETKVKVQ